MRNKQWVAGAIAATALVLGATAGVISVKAADTEKTAKDVFVYSQIGRDDYTSCDVGYSHGEVILGSEDEKYYTVITCDGKLHEIDNSDGTYGHINVASSVAFEDVLYSKNDDGKVTLYNFDGSYAYGLNGYHDYVSWIYFNDYYGAFYVDGSDVVIKNQDGETITQFTTQEPITYIYVMNDYYQLYDQGILKYYDQDGNYVDLLSKFPVDGFYATSINDYGDYYEVRYLKNDVNCFDEDDYYLDDYGIYQLKYYKKYYNLDLTEYSTALPEFAPDSSDIPQVTFNYSGFNDCSMAFTDYVNDGTLFQDNYTVWLKGNIKGYTVYYGYKDEGDYAEAVFDEKGNLLIDNPYSENAFIADKFVTVDKDSAGNYKYTLKQVNLASSDKVTSTVTVTDVDVNNLTDASGNKITKDDLDADAKALLDQKFEFTLDADAGVVTDGATLSVSKLVSGKEYDAAKFVVQKVAEHVAVFNIDLLDSTNAKIQPNGKLSITTDVPQGFNTARLAVYRLTDDGYKKLDSKVANGKVTFQTDHFSTYVIAEEKEEAASTGEEKNSEKEKGTTTDESTTAAENDTTTVAAKGTTPEETTTVAAKETTTVKSSATDQKNDNKTVPDTGDGSNAAVILILLTVSAGLFGWNVTAKKKVR
jgi:hypothetical protein